MLNVFTEDDLVRVVWSNNSSLYFCLRMMKINTIFFFLLCREDDERDESLYTAEDMCMGMQDFISYEIVRNRAFSCFKYILMCFPLIFTFSSSPIFFTIHI
jgi:hypothetical protein